MTPSAIVLLAVAAPDVYRLRNVAAEDAARVVAAFAARQGMAVRLATDPPTNTVRVFG